MEETVQVNVKSTYCFLVFFLEFLSDFANFLFQLFHLVVPHLVVQTLFARKMLDPLCVYVTLVTKVMDTTVQVCVKCQATFL